jgi:hypothetical protein
MAWVIQHLQEFQRNHLSPTTGQAFSQTVWLNTNSTAIETAIKDFRHQDFLLGQQFHQRMIKNLTLSQR